VEGSVMMKLLDRHDLKAVRKKFMGIYFLNLSDVILTLFLLQTGFFYEGNLLMRNVIDNKPLSLLLKAVLPLVLLLLLYRRMKEASIRQLVKSKKIINICLIFYILVNCSHLFWGTLYLSGSSILQSLF
jgi:hypothetical protein